MNSKIKRNIRQLLSLMSLILLIGICDVKAGATFNCETVQSGNWTDPAIWTACDGAYPNSPEDAVLIKNGHSIVFDSAIFLELYSFNMESFSELNVFNDQSSFRVVVHGADFNSQMGRIISETRIIINTFQGDVLLSDLNLTGENTLNINSAQNISFFGTPLAVNAYFINAKSNDINGEIHIYGDMQVANSQTYDSKVIIHNDLKFVGDSEFNNLLLLNSYNVEIEALNSDSSIENGLEGEINSTLTKTGDSGLILNSSILNGEIQIMEGELLIWGLVQTATSIFGEALISGFGEIDDSLTLSNNAVISPGSYSTPYNTLTIKDISVVSPDVIWDLNIRGHIPGTDYDQIIVTDSIALNGVLNSQIFGDYFVGDEFKIIDVQSLNSITGQFIGLPEGSLYRGKYQISYQGGDGNDVTLTTVCNSEALVTNNLDSGPGSLRNAIDSVCPSGSEIHFDNSYEINLSSPIVINDGQFLDINFDSGLSQTFTSSGNHPVLMVENGAYIRFQGVTIKDVTSDQ